MSDTETSPLSIRDALSSAMDAAEAAPPAPEVAELSPAAPEVAPETEAPVPAGERQRAPDGKFARAPETKPEAPAVKPPEAAAPAPETATAAVEQPKPPQSWRPAVREKWASLPPDVQAEVARREKETAVALQRAAEATKDGGAMAEVLRPFAGMLQAEGATPQQAVGSLLQTAAVLRSGAPAAKAATVAAIIKSYGIDIEQLANHLEGSGDAAQMQAPAQYQDPRVEHLFSALETAATRRQESLVADGQRRIDEFRASGKAEFFEDVKPLLPGVIRAAMEAGRTLTLEQAYDVAIRMDPELSKVQAQREAARAAAAQAAAVQQKRAAAASPRSNPAGDAAAPGQPKSVRGALEAALAAHQG